jgi:hypothetical protein
VTLLPIGVAIILIAVISYARSGKLGSFGQAIRNSDWHAWNDAMQDKQRELAELREAEPKR